MALRDLEKLQKAAEKLPPDEQLQLVQFLLQRAGKLVVKGKVVDLNKYAGTVKLKEDPMEYQKRVRAEWP
jgi:hypothetical protein